MSLLRNLWGEITDGFYEVKSFVGDKLQEAGEWIERTVTNLRLRDYGPKISSHNAYPGLSSSNFPNESSTDSSICNEEIIKKEMEIEDEIITEYQNEIQKRASARETQVKDFYLDMYKKYFKDFEDVFGKEVMEDIDSYINKSADCFSNTLRDEINTKVNSAYLPYKQLLSEKPTHERLQNYCDNVYKNADNNLLDLLQLTIENSNKYIGKCIVKYNDDSAKSLMKLKESLVKLAADEEIKAQEYKTIAEELVLAQFIKEETLQVI